MLSIDVLVLRRRSYGRYEKSCIRVFQRVRRYCNDMCTSRREIRDDGKAQRGERSLLDSDYRHGCWAKKGTHGYEYSPCMQISFPVCRPPLSESIRYSQRCHTSGRLPIVTGRKYMRG